MVSVGGTVEALQCCLCLNLDIGTSAMNKYVAQPALNININVNVGLGGGPMHDDDAAAHAVTKPDGGVPSSLSEGSTGMKWAPWEQ